jgi:hypothetical protein
MITYVHVYCKTDTTYNTKLTIGDMLVHQRGAQTSISSTNMRYEYTPLKGYDTLFQFSNGLSLSSRIVF